MSSSVASCQLPVASKQSAVGSRQHPVSSIQLPVANYRTAAKGPGRGFAQILMLAALLIFMGVRAASGAEYDGRWAILLAGVSGDITERKRAEATLRESEQRFRLLAENIPGVIYLCANDERYTMLYLNEWVEALTGYPKEEFLKDRISFVELYHPEDAPGIPEQVDRALTERRPFHLTYRLKHRSGEWRWVEEYGVGPTTTLISVCL